MAFEVTYTVDEEMQMRSARQMLRAGVGAKLVNIAFVAFVVAFSCAARSDVCERDILRRVSRGGRRGATCAAAVDAGVRADGAQLPHARRRPRCKDRHGRRGHRGEPQALSPPDTVGQVTRIRETQDFVTLYHDAILVATASKEHIGEEGLEIIRRHMPVEGLQRRVIVPPRRKTRDRRSIFLLNSRSCGLYHPRTPHVSHHRDSGNTTSVPGFWRRR